VVKRIGVLLLVVIMSLSLFIACNSEKSEETKSGDIILATTTSTQDSGLLDVLLPIFEAESGYTVKTIAVGTGAALKMGEEGNADVLMTHAPASEQKLVDAGFVIDYTLLMHNDFVVVGPAADAAGIKSAISIVEAFSMIFEKGVLFVSRGDDSGTNKKELSLWKEAGITPEWNRYQETGSGMGDSLNIAAEKEGYILTDRATYLNLKDTLGDLEILFEGDAMLENIYHVMAVNKDKFSAVNYDGAIAFIEFLIDSETQGIIKEYGVDKFGQPLFFPDAIS